MQYSTSYHPQMDGQTEAVNRSLGDLLRCLVEENPNQWEAVVAQAEFAYYYSKNQTTSKSLSEVVYGKQSMHLYDLAPLPKMGRNSLKGGNMVDLMKKLHEEIRLKIEESNAKYKKYVDQKRRNQSFQEGDLVMVYRHKERFLSNSYSKLSKRKIGPYKIIKKIAENTYVVDLPKHIGLDSTFNILDLYSYTGESVKEVSNNTKLEDELLPRRRE